MRRIDTTSRNDETHFLNVLQIESYRPIQENENAMRRELLQFFLKLNQIDAKKLKFSTTILWFNCPNLLRALSVHEIFGYIPLHSIFPWFSVTKIFLAKRKMENEILRKMKKFADSCLRNGQPVWACIQCIANKYDHYKSIQSSALWHNLF